MTTQLHKFPCDITHALIPKLKLLSRWVIEDLKLPEKLWK